MSVRNWYLLLYTLLSAVSCHAHQSHSITIRQVFLETERLALTSWVPEEDLEALYALHQNPHVLQYLLRDQYTRAMLAEKIEHMNEQISEYGFGSFACFLKHTGEFIGLVGVNRCNMNVPFAPCLEIGWRIAEKFWGQGYATEAARAVLHDCFVNHDIAEIVSFAVAENVASQRIMQKLGMHHNPDDDFHHPLLPADHRNSLHVLYRITREEFTQHQDVESVHT